MRPRAGRWRSWRLHRERWLLAAAAFALAATFLRPKLPVQRQLFEHVVVIDISQSMNVTDQRLDGKPVSRLVYAKSALRLALTALPCGSKLGWAVFTGYRSYLLSTPVEVCANLGELRSTLASIDGLMSWVGGSEIAKGLHSGLLTVKQLPGVPTLVFVTDGHEAPPLNPRHRPAFDDDPGKVPALILGVGDPKPSPIPKSDPQGRPLGYWRAEDVAQSDPYSQGRGASVAGESMVEPQDAKAPAAPGAALGATPQFEHLSGLREPYLQLLAAEQGMAYLRLQSPRGLVAALTAPAFARPVRVRADARPVLAGLALVLLLARHLRWPGTSRRWAWPMRGRTSAPSAR
ncbi:MAG: VWA domain-containing protein [Rubrivivax sp.]|nr:VWA domain-containing protein [Rubrivivax sp.]